METNIADNTGEITETPIQTIETPTAPVQTDEDLFKGSGLFVPVKERPYSNGPTAPATEPAASPKKATGFKPVVKTGPEFQEFKSQESQDATDQSATGGTSAAQGTSQEQPAVPEMKFDTPVDMTNPAGAGPQIGQVAGTETSKFLFNLLENAYPDILAYLCEIDPAFVEKAKLDTELEGAILTRIYEANKGIKKDFKISDYHKANILPPLKSILQKQGWEQVIPDPVMLVIGLGLLAFDSYLKVRQAKRENKVLEKNIRMEVNKAIQARAGERSALEILLQKQQEMQATIDELQRANKPV